MRELVACAASFRHLNLPSPLETWETVENAFLPYLKLLEGFPTFLSLSFVQKEASCKERRSRDAIECRVNGS